LSAVFQASEITAITIRGGRTPHADLRFCPRTARRERVVERLVSLLRHGAADSAAAPIVATAHPDGKGVVRYFRHGTLVNGWNILLDEPGRLRLKNRALHRRSALCQAIERELAGVLGIDQYRTSALAGTVRVEYDPARLAARDIIEILDSALDGAGPTGPLDQRELSLPLCTAAVPLAAAAQFAIPALLPAAAAVLACTSIPTLRSAQRTIFRERRLRADVLDSVVLIGCLVTMSIFSGTVLCWCVGVGRVLVDRTRVNSRKAFLAAFGKQPRHARLYRDGTESRVPVAWLRKGDTIVADAGDLIPVDGRVVAGRAMIDPHALTGGFAPVERGVGDPIFASTLMLAGRVYVAVESAGGETASARIGRILRDSAGYTLTNQRRGERLAERLTVPTLALAAVGMSTMGPGAALAVLHRDFATGLRMAAPLAMVGTLARCAHHGIVVRHGRALEAMNEVDTVVFELSDPPADQRPGFPDVVEGLRDRGIGRIAVIRDEGVVPSSDVADSPEIHSSFTRIRPVEKADYVERFRAEGRKVCLVVDGLNDPRAATSADVSISMGGAASIATDAAHVIFLDDDLAKLCQLRDIAADLNRQVAWSRTMVLGPNVVGIAGVFAMGFGIMASVVINNLSSLAALGVGAIPLREVAQLEAERRHRLDINQTIAAERALSEPIEAESDLSPTPRSDLACTEAAVYDRSEWHLDRDAPHSSAPGPSPVVSH
jgi:hypothetical protein